MTKQTLRSFKNLRPSHLPQHGTVASVEAPARVSQPHATVSGHDYDLTIALERVARPCCWRPKEMVPPVSMTYPDKMSPPSAPEW